MSWEWITNSAQGLGPIMLILLGAIGVLWRTHILDQKTLVDMNKSQGEAQTATAVAMEKLASAIRDARRR